MISEKNPKKDIINNSTNISPLRLHQSMKLKISTHFQMAEKTRDTWLCEYLPEGDCQQICTYAMTDIKC